MDARRTFAARLVLLVAVATLVGSAGPGAFAQAGSTRGELGTGGRNVIKGRIYLPDGGTVGRRKVTLFFKRHGDEVTVMSDQSGSFTFDGLQAGSYVITVHGGAEYEDARETVTLEEFQRGNTRMVVPVYLMPKGAPRASSPAAGVAALDVSIPAEAREQYTLAAEAAGRGDARRAIELYKAAIAAHPEFYAAHAELGVEYMKEGEIDYAVAVLRRATAIDPRGLAGQVNLGAALLEKRSFAEARDALEAAIDIDGTSAKAHYYLGVALIGLRDLKGAERELTTAVKANGREVPMAHYYLGGIYMAWRQKERAAEELETYLREAPKPKDPERVRRTIAELRGKS